MKKILIYSWLRGIGDGIINSGYIVELKKIYPDSEIDIFCYPTYALPYETNPYVNKIYKLKTFKRKMIKSVLVQLNTLWELRKNKYDIVIDTGSSYQKINFKFLKMINGKDVYGFYKNNNKYGYTKEYLSKIYSHLSMKGSYEPFNLLTPPKYVFIIPNESKKKAEIFLKEKININKKNILFNPEGAHNKTLHKDKIIEIFNEFSKLKDTNIFVNSTKKTRDMIIKILEKTEYENIFLAYEGNIFDVGALLEKMDLCVSVDTALVHMASALGINVVGIYANTSKSKDLYPPRFVKYEIVTQKEKSKKSDDLHNFSIEELILKVKKMLNDN